MLQHLQENKILNPSEEQNDGKIEKQFTDHIQTVNDGIDVSSIKKIVTSS